MKPKGQAGGHEQCEVRALADGDAEDRRRRPHTDRFGHELHQEQRQDHTGPAGQRREGDHRSRPKEEERCQDGEGDRAKPVHEDAVLHEDQLDLGLAHPVPEDADHEARGRRQRREHPRAHHHEDQQDESRLREQPAQGEDGPEVGNEARREDQLPELGTVQPGLDHDRVHDGRPKLC
jgi:hypothetical protein